jgi:hypothetical protein
VNRREKRFCTAFGFLLALVTLATRWPIRAKTFFEFDSINFAVATFRFDLREVTPQMPGYILHVLLGRALYWFTGDLNQAYVGLSILLSIGAVLFLWRAAAQLRGERVAVIAALLWITTPLFWFHGAVNAIYAEEAFFTSLLLYLGLKIITNYKLRITNNNSPMNSPFVIRNSSFLLVLYFVAFSLACAARQTSLLFFLPATIYVVWKCRPTKNVLLAGIACFIIVTGLWAFELLRESGGVSNYLSYLRLEGNFKTQSILFGNSWQSQFDTIEKAAFYLPLSLGASTIALLAVFLIFPRRTLQFLKENSRNLKAQFIILLPLLALLFYFIIFFMKAGYYLNVVPSAILIAAVIIDQTAIWLAEREKRRSSDKLKLTRPIITRNVLVISGAVVALNVAWFVVPWPGTSQERYNNEDTRNSFIHGAVHRYENSSERILTLANRAFEYTNISGIRAVDSLNDVTYHTLLNEGCNDTGQVIIASWWYRWCYLLLPHAITYDIELDPKSMSDHQSMSDHPGALWVGRAHEMQRANIYDSVVRFHSSKPVVLLLRHDRPDFETVSRQLHMERLPMPEYLDAYQILDSIFVLKWGNRTFVKDF